MTTLKDRLVLAEEEFYAALVDGETAMSSFNERWEALLQDIDIALESTGLDSETSALAHETALRIAELADVSVNLFCSYNEITAQLIGQLDSLMEDLTLEDDVCSYSSFSALKGFTRDIPSSSSDVYHRKRRRSDVSPRSHTQFSKKPRMMSEHPHIHSPHFSRAFESPVICAPPLRSPVLTPSAIRSPPIALPLSKTSMPSEDPAYTPTSSKAVTPHRSGRKRRVSDADLSSVPLRHKRICVGIRAVSDTILPTTTTAIMRENPTRSEPSCTNHHPRPSGDAWPNANPSVENVETTSLSSLPLGELELSGLFPAEPSSYDPFISTFVDQPCLGPPSPQLPDMLSWPSLFDNLFASSAESLSPDFGVLGDQVDFADYRNAFSKPPESPTDPLSTFLRPPSSPFLEDSPHVTTEHAPINARSVSPPGCPAHLSFPLDHSAPFDPSEVIVDWNLLFSSLGSPAWTPPSLSSDSSSCSGSISEPEPSEAAHPVDLTAASDISYVPPSPIKAVEIHSRTHPVDIYGHNALDL